MTPTKLDSAGHDIHTHDAHHLRHGHLEHDGLYNEDVAHEDSDVNIQQLLGYTIGLAVMCVVSAVIVLGLFKVFEKQAAAADPVLSPHARPAGQEPPEPRLLLNEPRMLQKQRSMEAETLGEYGWTDKASGVARIPIEDAKKLLLHKGIAVRSEAPPDAWLGTHSPASGESSSGRNIPLRPAAAAQPPAPVTTPEPEHKPAPAPHKGGEVD
jgi:hypothetical protein